MTAPDTRFNQFAQQYMADRGFRSEEEPTWIETGRKPDFYCEGCGTAAWLEVKSMPDTPEEELLFRLFAYLKTHGRKVAGLGHGVARISPAASERQAKSALALLNWIFRDPRAATADRIVAIVPIDADEMRRVSFEYRSEDGRVLVASSFSPQARYAYPGDIEPESYDQAVTICENDTPIMSEPAFRILEPDNYILAIHVTLGPSQFSMLSAGHMSARPSMNRYRIRKAVGDARVQIKNACRFKEAPALVFIFQDGPPCRVRKESWALCSVT